MSHDIGANNYKWKQGWNSTSKVSYNATNFGIFTSHYPLSRAVLLAYAVTLPASLIACGPESSDWWKNSFIAFSKVTEMNPLAKFETRSNCRPTLAFPLVFNDALIYTSITLASGASPETLLQWAVLRSNICLQTICKSITHTLLPCS